LGGIAAFFALVDVTINVYISGNMNKHVAIYLRVSSKSQDVASQEQDLKQWGTMRDEPVEWYRDSFTGKTMDRPGFGLLEREIAAGNVSTLTALFDDLRQRKVNLISLRDGLDLPRRRDA
jgi:DNA invertase Pin-like site-specific DNA recombinase